MMTNHSE
jgi:FixJ family two-component response regulator